MPQPKHSIPFGGQPVASVSVRVTNAGDGLSEALRVDPVDLQFGQRVYQVIEGFVVKATVAPDNIVDPGGAVQVQYVIKAGVSTLVDADTVIAAIDLTRNRILRAQEEADEQQQIEGTERPVETAPEFPGAGDDGSGFYDPALDPDAAVDAPTPIGRSRSHKKKETDTPDA